MIQYGYQAILLIILIIVLSYLIYKTTTTTTTTVNAGSLLEPFLFIEDSKLYMPPKDNLQATEIKYQLPVAGNNLTDIQLQDIDSDVLRNTRNLKNFSLTDELDFYQMYNLLKQLKGGEYTFTYNPTEIDKKSHIIPSEKLISLNSGAINSTDLELFNRIKLELISVFNHTVIKTGYYTSYHPYQFYKIINSNLISEIPNGSLSSASKNMVFTLTIAREYKYQQFNIYFDIDVSNVTGVDTNNYKVKINKVELIGIPIPKTIEFHENKKTSDKPDLQSLRADPNAVLDNKELLQNDLIRLVEYEREAKEYKTAQQNDYYYRDQVSDSARFNVRPVGDKSRVFQDPNMKFIDRTERSDIDLTLLDENSVAAKIEEKRMNIARDQQFNNHRCFGLVNGESQELPQYKNPVFCKSYHPEINQNGIWDAPCQVNTDCPFYQANKNYPNEFGKCNKETGKCEMPLGLIPLGFTKFGKVEPNCYNCGNNSKDNKCCGKQVSEVVAGTAKFKSPDYIFADDNSQRLAFAEQLESYGLKANPSI
jgi:hypothetical protein